MEDIDMQLWIDSLHSIELDYAISLLTRKVQFVTGQMHYPISSVDICDKRSAEECLALSSGISEVLRVLKTARIPLLKIMAECIANKAKQTLFEIFFDALIQYGEAFLTCAKHHFPLVSDDLHTMTHWQFLALSTLRLTQMFNPIGAQTRRKAVELAEKRECSFKQFCTACDYMQSHPVKSQSAIKMMQTAVFQSD
jgi:hypothetical protein